MIDNDPYWDYEDDLEDECFHEDYEIDILTGMASCDHCGHRWMMTTKQLERHHELQADCDRYYQQLEEEGFALNEPSDGQKVSDDEIPF